jgi:hypothetical protein
VQRGTRSGGEGAVPTDKKHGSLAESGVSDDELQQHTGLDPPTILSLCRQIAQGLKQEGLPAGEALKPATEQRNLELYQDDAAQAIIDCMHATSFRDHLLKSRAAGIAVEDL